jgi:serine/threonine-protein kinase
VADLTEQLTSALGDRYRLERELGRGGMATVYLAQDLRHHRRVALKVLHPELAYALGTDRFLREIEVAANLTHPHILPLHDSGEAAGLLFYVMPYVEGESLRGRLNRERQLPVDDAVRIAREVADALAYAHDHGIIHRDIKPENILLSGGHALVADFGIARALGQSGGERLTETGMTVGTAAYMSPEQALGDRQIDGRSDGYSLGCVLYEMLAGEPPYTGPTAQAIIAKRLSDPVPSVRRIRPGIPEGLASAVTRALAPVVADRWPTSAEFARAVTASSTESATAATAGAAQVPARDPSAAHGGSALSESRRTLLVAALAFLLGLGVLFAWRQSQPGESEPSGPKRLAVLPFENLGSPEDDYFADGVTDEVRGKLAALPGLQVIASASSNEYKDSPKSPQEIARELSVQYLLVGKVRWDKSAGGQSRVRVSPELVEVATASTRWQEPFEAPLTDVFQVQADIAGRVVQALDLALGAGQREQLGERPTGNIAAYEAFLQAEAIIDSGGADPGSLRRAIGYYERAVALDSAFARAWAGLADARVTLYANTPGKGVEAVALQTAARSAAERAIALAPEHPDGRSALGRVLQVIEGDRSQAGEQFALALRLAPNDVDVLANVAAANRASGRWAESLAHLRRAAELDPRSARPLSLLGSTLLWLRRYPEAREALDRTLAIAPTSLDMIQDRAMVELAQGDLPAARRVLAAAPKDIDSSAFAAFMATYFDLGWILDEPGQRLVLGLGPEAFGDDTLSWGLALAQLNAFRGNESRARAVADSALAAVEASLRGLPEDDQLHSLRGVALAYVGRHGEAIRAGRRGVNLMPVSKDAYWGVYNQLQLARIYILARQFEEALDQLEPLLEIPSYLSPGWLQIDPTFDPLRSHPRFQRLVNTTP